jgi:hypothetical protein
VADFPLLAGISADISKGHLHQPDRQFEYLLVRHAHVGVIQQLFLSMRGPANLRYCLKNFGCGIVQYARGAIFSHIMRANSARNSLVASFVVRLREWQLLPSS